MLGTCCIAERHNRRRSDRLTRVVTAIGVSNPFEAKPQDDLVLKVGGVLCIL